MDPPGRRGRCGLVRAAHGPGHLDRLGQVARVLVARPVPRPSGGGRLGARPRPHRVVGTSRHHPLPLPHQGPRRRPARRARPTPGRIGDRQHAGRDLRRRHLARGATLGAGVRRRRAHQPRLPALRAPAAAPALGADARVAAVRGGRRVPRVPRGVRGSCGPGPAAAAATRRVVRRLADVPAGVRDHLRPGGERRAADRRGPVRGVGRDRRRVARRSQDVRALAATRAARVQLPRLRRRPVGHRPAAAGSGPGPGRPRSARAGRRLGLVGADNRVRAVGHG